MAGRWDALPNSQLRPVVPKTIGGQPWSYYGGNATPDLAIMLAWGGGCYDALRDRLLVHGGGHSDGMISNVFAFDIEHALWSLASDQGSAYQYANADRETNPDGSPCSVHSYHGQYYSTVRDRFFRFGGTKWGGAGHWHAALWELDPAARTWTRKADPWIPTTDSATSAWDTLTDTLLLNAGGYLMRWNPATNAWAQLVSGGPGGHLSAVSEFDKRRNQLYVLSQVYANQGANKIKRWDFTKPMSQPPNGVNNQNLLATTGDVTWAQKYSPGASMFYGAAPADDRLLVYAGGQAIGALNPETLAWETYAMADGDNPGAMPKGMYGRFRVRTDGTVVAVHKVDGLVYIGTLPAPTVTRTLVRSVGPITLN